MMVNTMVHSMAHATMNITVADAWWLSHPHDIICQSLSVPRSPPPEAPGQAAMVMASGHQLKFMPGYWLEVSYESLAHGEWLVN